MMIVVTGGSGSGKSAFAEEKIVSFGDAERIYIATMFPYDEESKKRVKRHREMRKDKRFTTVECFTGLCDARIPEGSVVLLECMSNLTANEMFLPEGAGDQTVPEIMKGVRHLKDLAAHLVIVTNEIFSEVNTYEGDTRTYQSYLGRINQEMAKMADEVYEVVYGIPVKLKGEEPA